MSNRNFRLDCNGAPLRTTYLLLTKCEDSPCDTPVIVSVTAIYGHKDSVSKTQSFLVGTSCYSRALDGIHFKRVTCSVSIPIHAVIQRR